MRQGKISKWTCVASTFVWKIDTVEYVVAENVFRKTTIGVAPPVASGACPCHLASWNAFRWQNNDDDDDDDNNDNNNNNNKLCLGEHKAINLISQGRRLRSFVPSFVPLVESTEWDSLTTSSGLPRRLLRASFWSSWSPASAICQTSSTVSSTSSMRHLWDPCFFCSRTNSLEFTARLSEGSSCRLWTI